MLLVLVVMTQKLRNKPSPALQNQDATLLDLTRNVSTPVENPFVMSSTQKSVLPYQEAIYAAPTSPPHPTQLEEIIDQKRIPDANEYRSAVLKLANREIKSPA